MLLIIIKGANVGSIYPLNRERPVVIGRGKDCDIRILDLLVSRKHCQIQKRDNDYFIRDLNSTNKTLVNKIIVKGDKKLNMGDLLEIGNTILLFTNQKEISIKSVSDYDMLRKSQTRPVKL